MPRWGVSRVLIAGSHRADTKILIHRSPQQITARLDELINEIRGKYQKEAIKESTEPCDVLVVAHGHILRAFAARFIGKDIAHNPSLILEAGGVGTLR
jgi:sedoheptulose-bisphosphatase